MLVLDKDKDAKRGRGLWEFNNSLLQDDSFIKGMNTTVSNTLEENLASNPHTIWEILKYEMRKFSIKFSQDRSKLIRAEKDKHDPASSPNEEEYENSKSWLENWHEEYTKGAILRSKAQWYENGEKSTKYFLNLEKNNSIKNTIRKVIIKNDNNEDYECDDEMKILNHTKTFDEKLFTRKSTKTFDACSTFLRGIETPQKSLCDKLLEMEELSVSLDSMQTGISPGNDGLTIEFYKSFWSLLKTPLYNSVVYSKSHGSLSISQRQVIIKLLVKKDKDTRYIENWRPISLLNVDTKIISKGLANRLKDTLPDIISHDQTAYVKGRFIGESTRLISDILEVTETFNVGGYILTADIEKSFRLNGPSIPFSRPHKIWVWRIFYRLD